MLLAWHAETLANALPGASQIAGLLGLNRQNCVWPETRVYDVVLSLPTSAI